jgi:hypothetical protein
MKRVSLLLIGLGLMLLFIAGLFLMAGHHPDSYVMNAQAEVAANYAYSLLWLGLLFSLIPWRQSKD